MIASASWLTQALRWVYCRPYIIKGRTAKGWELYDPPSGPGKGDPVLSLAITLCEYSFEDPALV